MLDPMFLITGSVEIPIDTWTNNWKGPEPDNIVCSPKYLQERSICGDTSEPRQTNQPD